MHWMTRRLRAMLGHALVVRTCALTLMVTAAVVVATKASAGADRQPRAPAAGTFTPIEVPGVTFTTAIGINARGQVVGNFTDAMGARRGFLLDRGVFTLIDVPGATASTVFGITDRGQIVGFFIDAEGVTRGFCSTVRQGRGQRMARPSTAGGMCLVPDRPTSGLAK
jgi:probable HAF family extracellular repeat protein